MFERTSSVRFPVKTKIGKLVLTTMLLNPLLLSASTLNCNAADDYSSNMKFRASSLFIAKESNIGADRNVISDKEIIPSQFSPSEKVDINAATIDIYKKFPGMYPHAAGSKI